MTYRKLDALWFPALFDFFQKQSGQYQACIQPITLLLQVERGACYLFEAQAKRDTIVVAHVM